MDNNNFNRNKELEEELKKEKKRKSKWLALLVLLLIILLLFSLALTVFYIDQRTTFFGRAFSSIESSGDVALENSYLFISPLSAQSGGKEKIRLTVFLLDNQGRGVANQAVFLGQNEKLEVTIIQGITDNLGRAYFDISAFSSGDYLIEARVDNLILPQRVKLNFK
jgi:flagellar basal body-associated protein FliL